MTENDREQVALFRYGLIAPLLNGQYNTNEYLSKICATPFDVPYYGPKDFTPKTILSWLRNYRKFGYNSLLPKARNDKGQSRALSLEKREAVLNYRNLHRDCNVTLFYERLIKNQLISEHEASYYTIYRLLKVNNLINPVDKVPIERKRFAYDSINTLWQGDMSVGPHLIIGGKKIRTNLFAFIDDSSRLIPFAKFFYSEKFESMKSVLQEAIIRRGIPKIIYVDNGKVYKASTLITACAKLGINLVHTKPYDPQSKGKIERFFLTVRTRFYPLLKENPPKDIDELNKRFWKWLEEDYHRRVHSSLGMSPLDKFMSQANSIKIFNDPESLNAIFYKRDFRKVYLDSTISVNSKLYEVPLKYVGEKIEIRYDLENPDTVYIFENDQIVFTAKPVSFSDNSHVRRKRDIPTMDNKSNNMFYQSTQGGE